MHENFPAAFSPPSTADSPKPTFSRSATTPLDQV
jgi:hypothetical protein